MNYCGLWALFLSLCTITNLPAMHNDTVGHLPYEIQQKILTMAMNYKPLAAWIPWLIERNGLRPLKKEWITRVQKIKTAADNSMIRIKYIQKSFHWNAEIRLVQADIHTYTVNCADSFANHAATHPVRDKKNETGMITITLHNHSKFAVDPCGECFIDSVISQDGSLFIGISDHKIMIWNITQQKLIDMILINDRALKKIVAINADDSSITLQARDNTIFAYDLNTQSQHIIYTNEKARFIHPIAFGNYYCFLHSVNQLPDACVEIIYLYDIAQLFSQLHIDQIKLLSWIHKAALTGYMLNLKGNSPGIIHAREAFFHLPEKIKRLVKEFIMTPRFCIPPKRLHCTIS